MTLLTRTVRLRLREGPTYDIALLAVAVVVCAALRIGIADPIYYRLEKTKPFVQLVETLQGKNPGDLVFYNVGPDGEDVKFMVNLSMPQQPRFVSSLDSLIPSTQRDYIITKADIYRDVPSDVRDGLDVLARGKVGHCDFVCLATKSLPLPKSAVSREENGKGIATSITP